MEASIESNKNVEKEKMEETADRKSVTHPTSDESSDTKEQVNEETRQDSDNSVKDDENRENASSNISNKQGDSVTEADTSDKTSDTGAFKMPILVPKVPDKKVSAAFDAANSETKAKPEQNKTVQKPKAVKTVAPSPAEKLKQNQIAVPYKEPEWGGPSEVMYSFEVLKKGVIIDEIDLTTKSFHVFGRLPSCDVAMEHPSLSRYHAVVQHCSKPSEKHSVGWYLYDLDSTHGTWINKAKVKPNIFYRLKVGHVIKFGGSTRLHILKVSFIFTARLKHK